MIYSAWDEKRVVEWLRSINCGQYEQLFRINNVTGSNLIECDQLVLKEMGIKKIGDRVRIFVGIKQLRTKAVGNHKKRIRDEIAAMDNSRHLSSTNTPSTTSSPRRPYPTPTSSNGHRGSVILNGRLENHMADYNSLRPGSPLRPNDTRRGQTSNPYPQPSPPSTGSRSRAPGRPSPDAAVARLPPHYPVIRVIFNHGQTRVLNIERCNTAEEIILNTLKKLGLPENHVKNYCFYVLDDSMPNPTSCRRLSDSELVRVCKDTKGYDRGRLILRKIHAGEPEEDDVRKAISIFNEEMNEAQNKAIQSNAPNAIKVERTLGESFDSIAGHPATRARADSGANQGRNPSEPSGPSAIPRPRIKEFLGARPPSELISQELTSYFPDHKKEAIERTVRMSMRRSARLSKAYSHISVGSNASGGSGLKDAPPLPSVPDAWLAGGHVRGGPRPLSVHRFANPQNAYRDSIASSSLQPLPEESPVEPNRKSYVSFDSDSNVAGASTGDDAQSLQSYFEESGSSGPATEAGGSLNDHLRNAIAEDGEEPDEELDTFLKGDSFDNIQWMKGALIGQGSFGSVFLALHALTGELMAVKQVEMPSRLSGGGSSELDKKREKMVGALRIEIDLLRSLQHPNIVQYLGSNSDNEHFNIFLEYVAGGSVAAMLTSYGHLHEPLIRNFVRQILAGLSYLHGQDIIHRDIKGANVLVDNKGIIKISDFGISKRDEASALFQGVKAGAKNRPSLQGSVFWMAPEVVKQTSHTRKADIWSLGCLIVEMYTGTHPFPNFNQMQAMFQIGVSSARPNAPDNASDEGKEFLARTFEIDHEKRPSADELLLSPFLKQIA